MRQKTSSEKKVVPRGCSNATKISALSIPFSVLVYRILTIHIDSSHVAACIGIGTRYRELVGVSRGAYAPARNG